MYISQKGNKSHRVSSVAKILQTSAAKCTEYMTGHAHFMEQLISMNNAYKPAVTTSEDTPRCT